MITKTTFITSLKYRITRAILSGSGTTPELTERLIMWQKDQKPLLSQLSPLTIPIGMLS